MLPNKISKYRSHSNIHECKSSILVKIFNSAYYKTFCVEKIAFSGDELELSPQSSYRAINSTPLFQNRGGESEPDLALRGKPLTNLFLPKIIFLIIGNISLRNASRAFLLVYTSFGAKFPWISC